MKRVLLPAGDETGTRVTTQEMPEVEPTEDGLRLLPSPACVDESAGLATYGSGAASSSSRPAEARERPGRDELGATSRSGASTGRAEDRTIGVMRRTSTNVLMVAGTLLLVGAAIGLADEPLGPEVLGPSDPGRPYDVPPKRLRIVPPEYPPGARGEGTVELELQIDAKGRVVNTRITKSIAEFDKAAVTCVSKWEFIPARKGGRPVPATVTGMVTFKPPSKAKGALVRDGASENAPKVTRSA